jgi:hypothetical protein
MKWEDRVGMDFEGSSHVIAICLETVKTHDAEQSHGTLLPHQPTWFKSGSFKISLCVGMQLFRLL